MGVSHTFKKLNLKNAEVGCSNSRITLIENVESNFLDLPPGFLTLRQR
jgi:hypothetical protein